MDFTYSFFAQAGCFIDILLSGNAILTEPFYFV